VIAAPTPVSEFCVEPDTAAEEWLRRRSGHEPLVITFSVTRCCGGTKVCDVRVRIGAVRKPRTTYTHIGEVGGRELLLDSRIAATMPRRIPITVRGVARRHLELDLSGEDWARLLYA
jgi:hypothetical protein